MQKKCCYRGCGNQRHAMGLCQEHYRARWDAHWNRCDLCRNELSRCTCHLADDGCPFLSDLPEVEGDLNEPDVHIDHLSLGA